jgi:predicted phosphoribosyltransferase
VVVAAGRAAKAAIGIADLAAKAVTVVRAAKAAAIVIAAPAASAKAASVRAEKAASRLSHRRSSPEKTRTSA